MPDFQTCDLVGPDGKCARLATKVVGREGWFVYLCDEHAELSRLPVKAVHIS